MLVLALYFCRAEVVPWLQAAGRVGRHVEQHELRDRLQPAHYRGSHSGRVGLRLSAGHYHEGQRWRGGLTSHLLDGHKLVTKRSDWSSLDWSSRFMLPSQCYTALLSKPMSPCLYKLSLATYRQLNCLCRSVFDVQWYGGSSQGKLGKHKFTHKEPADDL